MTARLLFRTLPLALAGAGVLGACSADTSPVPPTQEVEVLTLRVSPQAVVASDELPGRVAAFRTAEIRPQVGGILQRRRFEQGAMVRAGQVLFEISPAPLRADADMARATLQKAAAAYDRARTQAERLKPLVVADAISRQSYDGAVAARDQAAAELAEARATLRRRRIDLGFARVTAPIAGRIGAANLTEGALVTAADTTPLATIQQIDRVYVDVRQPAERYAQLRAAGGSAGRSRSSWHRVRRIRSRGASCFRASPSIRRPATRWSGSRSPIAASACCRACSSAPACRARRCRPR